MLLGLNIGILVNFPHLSDPFPIIEEHRPTQRRCSKLRLGWQLLSNPLLRPLMYFPPRNVHFRIGGVDVHGEILDVGVGFVAGGDHGG